MLLRARLRAKWWVACLVVLAFVLPMSTVEAATQKKAGSKSHLRQKANAKSAAKSKQVQPRKKVAKRTESRRELAIASNASAASTVAQHNSGVSEDLHLRSNAAMVIDQTTHQVLFDKNGSSVLPIASLTKLMTALVVADASLPLDENITITDADIDTLKGSGSRLPVGTTLTRGELLHLALMSSENRAAHALGRSFPGGLDKFVETMNVKAKLLGMLNTRFVDPTGLSPSNQSSAKDLAVLVSVAHDRPVIRELSTSPSYEVDTGARTLTYRNTNRLVTSPQWDIGLQKTGYISEAGRCLVMQAKVAGRELIMVFLDSAGKLTRIADAERVRKWMEAQGPRVL